MSDIDIELDDDWYDERRTRKPRRVPDEQPRDDSNRERMGNSRRDSIPFDDEYGIDSRDSHDRRYPDRVPQSGRRDRRGSGRRPDRRGRNDGWLREDYEDFDRAYEPDMERHYRRTGDERRRRKGGVSWSVFLPVLFCLIFCIGWTIYMNPRIVDFDRGNNQQREDDRGPFGDKIDDGVVDNSEESLDPINVFGDRYLVFVGENLQLTQAQTAMYKASQGLVDKYKMIKKVLYDDDSKSGQTILKSDKVRELKLESPVVVVMEDGDVLYAVEWPENMTDIDDLEREFLKGNS